MSDHERLAETIRLNSQAIVRAEDKAAELRESAERGREVAAHAREALGRIVAERDAYKTALGILADPENWSGDPEAHGAVLRGHLTPYELAVEVLAGLSSTTEE